MKIIRENAILIILLAVCIAGILTDPADVYWNQIGYKWETLLNPINSN